MFKSKNLFRTFTCIGWFSKIFSSKSFAVVVIRNHPGVPKLACTNEYLENILGSNCVRLLGFIVTEVDRGADY